MRRAVGMAGKDGTADTKPAEQGTAGRHSRQTLRPAQASKQTAHSWPVVQQKQPLPDDVLPLAMQVSGGSAAVLTARKAGSDLPTPVPTPPIASACHCPYPLPQFDKTQFGPNLTFFFVFLFLSLLPTITRPLTPSIVTVRLTYLSPTLLPTPTFPSQRGTREG